ncbi:MAG TPA: hypothetical protein PKH24_20900 [Sedimentisphaerales bacterium]|nr:hypothetical protein [Sedimentisphaerales bacterium]HNU28064.1 hypothetical protein [Sedimentisphaerales bacterium]
MFLKHLWCMGRINTPPQCPVDSTILQRAGLRYPMTRWAYVNSMDEHRRKIEYLTRCAVTSGLALAEWELIEFQDRQSNHFTG